MSLSPVIFWLWARSCYSGGAPLICCASRCTFPSRRTSLWTWAFSVYKTLPSMGSVHCSESAGRTKPLAQTEVSEQPSQWSSRRCLSPTAEWTKLFNLVMVHVNKLNHCVTQTQWHIQNHHSLFLIYIHVPCCGFCRWLYFYTCTSAPKYFGDLK